MSVRRCITFALLCSLGLLLAAPADAAPIQVSAGPYSQNFDTLIRNGTGQPWANDSTLPAWSLFNSTGAAITTYSAGNGGSNAGTFNSFGDPNAPERSLGGTASGGAYFGSPLSGAVAGWIAVAATNDTPYVTDSFTVEYDGEQWRNGGNTSAQTMVLEYGFGASFGAVSTWTPAGGAFNFTSPVVGAAAAAVNGNTVGRVANLGGTIGSLNWLPGQTLWLRWIENNDVANDHGLGIDEFGLTTTQLVPEPTTCLLAVVGLFGMVTRRRV